jgi:hypothetical protein
MSSPSNLYAEKIFSEHPIAFWALDDIADYVSLISEEQRDISSWTVSDGSAEIVSDISGEPFPNSITSSVIRDTLSSEYVVECTSPDIISLSQLNPELSTFSIGAFLYSKTPYIDGFDIGYEYYDTVSGSLVQDLKFFSTDVYENWIFISETFQPTSQNTSVRLVIRARFIDADDAENYEFLINGISFGQWSEEFNSTSLGVYPEETELGILGVPAKAYGIQNLDGYYAVRQNTLASKNSGMPMVYGTSNSTTLQTNNGDPSLVLPGLGFLNESGKFKDYTVEFWARINSDAIVDKRIFGNLNGSDGLYVNGPFLSLKVSSSVIRHYVGQWSRPMLIQIRYSEGSISLVVNGEQVGELFIDASMIQFPEEFNEDQESNDWMGFWAYEDVQPVEIESVAIYGYKVPVQVAKRRFVYGQGVEFPENINNAYSGSSIFIDYPFSKYSKNYSYPNIGRWAQGSYDNIVIDGSAITIPSYSKPIARFDDKSESEWLEDLEAVQEDNGFISLFPNSSWNNTSGNIYISDFSLSSEPMRAFYVVCKENEFTSTRQSLITIEDSITQNSFEVAIDGDSIDYILHSGSESTVVATKQRYFSGEEFVIGIDVQKFSDFYGGTVAQFFGNLSSFAVYIAGKNNFEDTYRGQIKVVGFCTSKNLSRIPSIFYADGTAFSDEFIDAENMLFDVDAGTDLSTSAVFEFLYDGGTLGEYSNSVLANHIASYHLSMQTDLSGFNLAIGSDSSWEDYIPLSYFGKNVMDSRGNERVDLDFIQFNINYPAPSIFVQESEPGEWTYEELSSEYSNPIERDYDSLDNFLYTGFENYDDLKNRAANTYKYDTSNSVVKTYITFQLLQDGANRSSYSYSNVETAPKNGIVSPGENWINTKYEVVNNMIIYPPQSISFEDLALVTHIEISTTNAAANPISIKSLEYASLSLSETRPTPIGTRFGNDIFPYKKDGLYFSYKDRNPFSIYKGSTPYLYLTRDSGITLRGQYDPQVNRGISVPINQAVSDDYKVIAMQLSMRFDQDFFPYAPTQIFELQSNNSYIRFYMVATHPSGKRAKIYAINSNGELENGLAFYLNGKIVKDPTITIKEWAMLGIRFANTQDFTNYTGAFRITGPLTVNNLSYYKSTNLQEVQNKIERIWFKVKKTGALTLDWNYWNAVPYLWNNVLVISETSYYGVDPSDIYKIYTGTNKIIVDDGIGTDFGDYAYTFYNNVSWQSQVAKAV